MNANNPHRYTYPASAPEAYTVEQIREAFAKHAGADDWGVKAFYESTLIAALRGEYDDRADRIEAESPHGLRCIQTPCDACGAGDGS